MSKFRKSPVGGRHWAVFLLLSACSQDPAGDSSANDGTTAALSGATVGSASTTGQTATSTIAAASASNGVTTGVQSSASASAGGSSDTAGSTGDATGSSAGGANALGSTTGQTSAGGSGMTGADGTSNSTTGDDTGMSSTGGGLTPGATIVPDPSWACGRPDGIVDPELGELVFTGSLDIGEIRDVGETQYGERLATDITGGMVGGGTLEADFLAGGLDFELTLSNGSIELEQVAMLRATDGSLIYLRTCGVAPPGESVVRIVPDFEVANDSSLAWLNTGQFVGTRTLDMATQKLEIAVYDVSMVAAAATTVQLTDPADAVDQPWDCLRLSGTRGQEVFTEQVAIGASLSVGASKNGTRNVIPITGGTVTGRVTGSVVNAGADYQIVSGGATLDARYVLASNDGEFVIVRNCGPGGALVPLFETRATGPYAFLNENTYLSSDPGVGSGGVSITFYELQ